MRRRGVLAAEHRDPLAPGQPRYPHILPHSPLSLQPLGFVGDYWMCPRPIFFCRYKAPYVNRTIEYRADPQSVFLAAIVSDSPKYLLCQMYPLYELIHLFFCLLCLSILHLCPSFCVCHAKNTTWSVIHVQRMCRKAQS